jgi:hypothetical protein
VILRLKLQKLSQKLVGFYIPRGLRHQITEASQNIGFDGGHVIVGEEFA